MKRWLLAATLLSVLALLLAACGGEASLDPNAGAAAPADSEQAQIVESEPAEELATATKANKKAKKKNKNNNKKATKQAKQKKRQVAVALGDPDEFDLVAAKAQVKAGMVTFKLKNTGSIEHELIVIRTDLESGELDTDESGAAVEHGAVAPHHSGNGEGAEHAGAHVGTHVPAGDVASVTLKLKAGSYALVCNLPGHYASGMHSNFTVAS